jgi:hypothetical protein
MPYPKKNEKKSDYISRAVREMKHEDSKRPTKEILGQAYGMWSQHEKGEKIGAEHKRAPAKPKSAAKPKAAAKPSESHTPQIKDNTPKKKPSKSSAAMRSHRVPEGTMFGGGGGFMGASA